MKKYFGNLIFEKNRFCNNWEVGEFQFDLGIKVVGNGLFWANKTIFSLFVFGVQQSPSKSPNAENVRTSEHANIFLEIANKNWI